MDASDAMGLARHVSSQQGVGMNSDDQILVRKVMEFAMNQQRGSFEEKPQEGFTFKGQSVDGKTTGFEQMSSEELREERELAETLKDKKKYSAIQYEIGRRNAAAMKANHDAEVELAKAKAQAQQEAREGGTDE